MLIAVLKCFLLLLQVNQELTVTSSPWFLDELSIVDLTYITHIERMCASVAYWSGKQIRGSRWPAIERWMVAFEAMPSYMATKSDYYTHVMDIPPQYGPGYSLSGSEKFAGVIGEISDYQQTLASRKLIELTWQHIAQNLAHLFACNMFPQMAVTVAGSCLYLRYQLQM